MNKTVITSGLVCLLAASSVYAVPPAIYDESIKLVVLGASSYTMAAEKGTCIDYREIGSQYDVTFKLNDHVYFTNGLVLEKSKGYYHDNFGFTYPISILRPYAEAGYWGVDNTLHYDIGIMANVWNCFRPFAEVTNFADKDKKSEIYGAQFQLTKHVYIQATYEVTTEYLDDNVKFGLFLQF